MPIQPSTTQNVQNNKEIKGNPIHKTQNEAEMNAKQRLDYMPYNPFTPAIPIDSEYYMNMLGQFLINHQLYGLQRPTDLYSFPFPNQITSAEPSKPDVPATAALEMLATTAADTADPNVQMKVVPIKKTTTLGGGLMKNHKEERVYVDRVRDTDVLCGRGGRSNHHPGNKRYRQVVGEMKQTYKSTEKKLKKTDLSRAIVDYVCNYGGRFIKKDGSTDRYYILSRTEARRKTSQALREHKNIKWTM